jgi:hypothetical protein
MMPACRVLSLAALLASPLAAAADGSVDLRVELSPTHVEITVAGPSQPVIGAIVLSLSPDLVHYLVGLPPLLADFAVLSCGAGEKVFEASIDQQVVPRGLTFYVQGVVFDGGAILASEVGHFVLDGSSPSR